MTNKYNLYLVFYPQSDGQYHVTCPEIPNCYTCGVTMDEARESIYALICELLPEAAANVDDEMFLEGLCMKGKTFEEAEFQIDKSSGAVFISMLEKAIGA